MKSEEKKITFREGDRRYAALMRRYEDETISARAFDASLRDLMVQDREGRWWAKARSSGEWHYYEDNAWVKGTPPYEQSTQEPGWSFVHEPPLEELVRVCARHKGRSFYVGDAIPEKTLETARARFPIPEDEGVAALVDISTTLTKGLGMAVCEGGLRWRCVTSTGSIRHGYVTWRDLADRSVFLQTRRRGAISWHKITVGENNVFFMEGEIKSADALFRLLRNLQDSLTGASTG